MKRITENCFDCKHGLELQKIFVCLYWGCEIKPVCGMKCIKFRNYENDNLHVNDAKESSEQEDFEDLLRTE